MKFLNVFILLLTVIMFGSCSDGSGNSVAPYALDRSAPYNREIDGLQGPVKEVRQVFYEQTKKGKKTILNDYTSFYDENGRKTKILYKIVDGAAVNDSTLFVYNDGGQYIEDGNAEVMYDENGRVNRIEQRAETTSAADLADNVILFTYDDQGRIKTHQEMDGTAEAYGGCLWVNTEYEYTDGHLSKMTKINPDMVTEVTEYDNNGVTSITIESDDVTISAKREYSDFDSIGSDTGNWHHAFTTWENAKGKNRNVYIDREIEYYDADPVLVADIPDVDPVGKNVSPLTGEWFKDLKYRYFIYSIHTSAGATSTLVIIALVLTVLAAIFFLWWLTAKDSFKNFGGKYGSNGMKRLWMYNYEPYVKVAMISLAIFTAFVTAVLLLFLFGGVTWALMGLVWLILKVLIFVGYACAILGGLALFGKEAAGCLPLIIGVIVIAWKDEINRLGTQLYDWGLETFNNLNIFEWGFKTITTFWDVLLIVFLAPIVLFIGFAFLVIILDLILLGIEWIITRIYSIRRPCPSCGSKRTPEYMIGGRPHPVGLFPGIYGTFTQRSPVTGEHIPTMLMNGRGKLQRRCRDCGQYINSNNVTHSFGTELHIGLVGPRSSGKSYLLYSALGQLMSDFPDRIEQIDKDSETDIAEKNYRITSHGGIQTRVSNRYRGVQLIVKSKLRPVPYHLFFYDVAGEKFNVGSQSSRTAMEFYRNVNSIIFIVDPTMIDFSHLPASPRMLEWAKANTASNEKYNLESAFEMMCRILEEQGRNTSGIYFTFALVKTDTGYLNAMGLNDSGNTPEMIEAFMTRDLGLLNLIGGAKARFRKVNFGSASVFGEGRSDMRSLWHSVLKTLGVGI